MPPIITQSSGALTVSMIQSVGEHVDKYELNNPNLGEEVNSDDDNNGIISSDMSIATAVTTTDEDR